jgi:putative DNA primase/helicase
MMNQRLCSPPLSEMELKKLFRSAWKYDPAYAMTELGNAQLFGDRHAHDLRWVFESKSWIVWGGFRWEFDKTGHVMQLMKTEMRKLSHAALDIEHDDARKAAIMWARKSEMRRVIDNSLALVPSEPGTTITQSQLDANPWLYACQNALIDLRTGKPVTAQREHLITKSANVQFDPSATCSRFIKFLDRILPNPEVRRFIQRYFGYALTADTREQCMLICWGTGSNGKSTLIGVMQNLMGDYGTQAATSTWMQKRDTIPNDVAALAGRRLVVSSEFEEGMRISQSLLKGATGEDKLSARFMRGEWFEFQPQFKIVFATNHKPVFDGGDAAMVRRIRLVEFGIKIPAEERDRTLPKQLEEEMPGIFNWLLAGCLEWQQHGLPIPDEVAKTTEEYARDSDNIGQFILDRCETKDKYNTASRPIYMAYLSWCAENNLRPYSVARFKQALIDRGFKSKRSSKGQEFQGLRCIRQDIEYKEAGEYEY